MHPRGVPLEDFRSGSGQPGVRSTAHSAQPQASDEGAILTGILNPLVSET